MISKTSTFYLLEKHNFVGFINLPPARPLHWKTRVYKFLQKKHFFLFFDVTEKKNTLHFHCAPFFHCVHFLQCNVFFKPFIEVCCILCLHFVDVFRFIIIHIIILRKVSFFLHSLVFYFLMFTFLSKLLILYSFILRVSFSFLWNSIFLLSF